MAYAQGTEVSVDRSQGELRQVLRKYGAEGIAIAESAQQSVVEFFAHERRIRFRVPMPDAAARAMTHTKQGALRSDSQLRNALAAEERRLWRALVLVVKAKLESTESGIESFEDAFLAQTVLPDNRTVSEQVQEPIKRAYIEGHVRPLLALEGSGS